MGGNDDISDLQIASLRNKNVKSNIYLGIIIKHFTILYIISFPMNYKKQNSSLFYKKWVSHTGNRTRACWVRASYPNH